MAYKALINWNNYDAGDIVSDDVAQKLLVKYKNFSDQSILEKVDDVVQPKSEDKIDDKKSSQVVEKSSSVSPKTKKSVRKNTSKKK